MSRNAPHRLPYDPLSDFCETIAAFRFGPFGETVNVVSLITAAGALLHWSVGHQQIETTSRVRHSNRQLVEETLMLRPAVHNSLAAGIYVGWMTLDRSLPFPRISIRHELAKTGVIASEPLRGLIRLAMPATPLTRTTLSRLKESVIGVSRAVSSETLRLAL
jgi:hypothetical protein